MSLHAKTLSIVALGALLFAATGCLERKETITIRPDGSVKIRIKYEGSEDDFKTLDALPSAASGWSVAKSPAARTSDSDRKQVWESSREFPAGAPLPASFAAPGDPDAALALAFPTTVEVEHRPDGTYYSFKRVYAPRAWSFVRYWHDRFVTDEIEKLGAKPKEQLSVEEEVKILKAFVDAAAHEQAEVALRAARQALPQASPQTVLAARTALLKQYQEIDLPDFVDRYKKIPESEHAEVFTKEWEQIVTDGLSAFEDALAASESLGAAAAQQFRAAYDRARKELDITEQTGGHQFKITLRMPGQIIAHNADRLSEDGDGAIEWTFDGEAFRDRAHELTAVSFVPKQAS